MKIIGSIPFLIITVIVLYTWVEIINTDYVATVKHYITLALVVMNGICYFMRYKTAIILTGLILVLSTFNLLSFYVETQTSSIGLNLGGTQIRTPEIQLWSLLLLVLYSILNFSTLVNWYLDKQEVKHKVKPKD